MRSILLILLSISFSSNLYAKTIPKILSKKKPLKTHQSASKEENLIPIKPVNPSKGLIIFLDSIKTIEKRALVRELLKSRYFMNLSSNRFARKHNQPTYQSAVKMLKKAVYYAKRGEHVILDSFVTTKFFYLKKTDKFDVLKIGIWCSLQCLKDRYDKKTGIPDSYKKVPIEADYKNRYYDLTNEEIIARNGTYRYNKDFLMVYDLFINVEKMTTQQIAKVVSDFLHRRGYRKRTQRLFIQKNTLIPTELPKTTPSLTLPKPLPTVSTPLLPAYTPTESISQNPGTTGAGGLPAPSAPNPPPQPN